MIEPLGGPRGSSPSLEICPQLFDYESEKTGLVRCELDADPHHTEHTHESPYARWLTWPREEL